MLRPREADVPLLFLVLVVLPLVTYVLLGIWNEAAKKKARISMLAQLAAEEAFSGQATAPTDVIPTQASSKTIGYVCARCFSPSTTRCARCKAVRYCSRKCQIVHWRQGHKERCQQWQDKYLNPSAVSTFATESVQPGDSIDVKLTSQVLGNDMNGPQNSAVSPNFSDRPYVTFAATSPDTMVDTSEVSVSGRKLLDKCSRNVLERDMHCYASVACSSEESIGSGAAAPAFHSTTLQTEILSKDIPSRCKPGTENITDSDETHKSQDKSHIFSKGPRISKIIMHQSHESKGKMRYITKPISSPEMSCSMPMDENVLYESESGLVFTSQKEDVQEGKHFSSGETLELRLAAERNSDKRSIKYTKPPYTLGSTISSSKKSVDKAPEEHYFPGIERASCFENESRISHKSVYMNDPLQSSHGFSDMAETKMADPRKSPKVPRRKLVGFMSYWKKNKVLFPYEDLVKLFQCEGWDISPRGLLNCGNSCYANAVLQCLTCTKPLMIYLLQRLHSRTCRVRDWCLMCEVEQHVSMLRDGGGPLSPNGILSNMKNIGWRMGDGNQEDAHEFLRLLVMSMQSICLEGLGGEKKVDPVLQETTLIQQIFGGRLRSKVKCMRCHIESERYENIMDLTLEIHGWVESLEDALTQFTAPEDLDGENMYRCGRCSEYVKARKQLSVHEVPNILTVVLKRFQTGKYGKINKFVTFPEMLDMIPFMTGTADNPPLYMLYAVVVHLDTLNASFSGHYVSYVKDLQGAWFRIDDSEVQSVPLSQVMSEGAYMLFYSRSFPRPPRAYIEKSLLRVPSPNALTPKTSKYPRHGQDKQNGTLLASENSSNVRDDFRPEYSEGIEEDDQSSVGRNINLSREMYGDPFSMDLSDGTSTSDWSLFTSSDDSSFTTESTRDSFSTVDYGDSPGLDTISSIFSPLYGPEYSHRDTITCKKFSTCKSETRFFSVSKGFVLDSSVPTQQPGNVHRGRNP